MNLRYRLWCWRKFFAEPEIRIAAHLARNGSRCLDIGANAGAYSYFMRRAGAEVHAFEPIAPLVADLRRRFGSSITIHPLAVSDLAGTVDIRAPLIQGKPAYGLASIEQAWEPNKVISHRVEMRTIDSFAFDNVSLIKIDIEGHEAAALRGAAATIARCRPALIIEAEERHPPGAVAAVWDQLRTLNYRGTFICRGKTQDITSFTPARHQRAFGDADYVFNFLFVPAN